MGKGRSLFISPSRISLVIVALYKILVNLFMAWEEFLDLVDQWIVDSEAISLITAKRE